MNIFIKTILWILGIFFLLSFFVSLPTSIVSAVASLLLATLLLPPIWTIIEDKLKIHPTRGIKIIIAVVLFIIIMSASPKISNPSLHTPSINTQKATPSVQSGSIQATVAAQQKKFYEVAKVIDGDTLSVTIDDKQEVIRLIGIDSPETVDPRKPVQCFGIEASGKAKATLSGKKVSLEIDPTQGDKDKYNRLLRYVYLEDSTSFNKLMISEGYAHEYTYNLPYKYQIEYKEAENNARENKKGLWADNTCPTIIPTSTPTSTTPVAPLPATTTQQGSFACAGKTTCGQMTDCAEAYYYMNNCEISRLDGDKDGVPCEIICK